MTPDLLAFGQVVLVDLALAGDNAVVVGALAASLPPAQRRIALTVGVGFAVVARIVLSLAVTWLLAIPGVMLVGGALLFWVAFKMWRELSTDGEDAETSAAAPQALHMAIFAIVAADLSMSLDNVLGVAGAAGGHAPALVAGLVLSIVLMGVAASLIAGAISRHRWLGYVGLALILLVAARMIWHGAAPFIS